MQFLIIPYYNTLLHHQADNQHRVVPLNFGVKQIFIVMDRAELVKCTHQTEGPHESLIPKLEEEGIIIVCFAVNIVKAFTWLRL